MPSAVGGAESPGEVWRATSVRTGPGPHAGRRRRLRLRSALRKSLRRPRTPAYGRSMDAQDIRWNDEARSKILEDSDRVLREAVLDLAQSKKGEPWEDVFAELNARLKDRFIDFEPGPDLRKYAEAVSAGEIESGS